MQYILSMICFTNWQTVPLITHDFKSEYRLSSERASNVCRWSSFASARTTRGGLAYASEANVKEDANASVKAFMLCPRKCIEWDGVSMPSHSPSNMKLPKRKPWCVHQKRAKALRVCPAKNLEQGERHPEEQHTTDNEGICGLVCS